MWSGKWTGSPVYISSQTPLLHKGTSHGRLTFLICPPRQFWTTSLDEIPFLEFRPKPSDLSSFDLRPFTVTTRKYFLPPWLAENNPVFDAFSPSLLPPSGPSHQRPWWPHLQSVPSIEPDYLGFTFSPQPVRAPVFSGSEANPFSWPPFHCPSESSCFSLPCSSCSPLSFSSLGALPFLLPEVCVIC